MPKAPFPSDEQERLRCLRRYQILDTLPEQEYDDLTRIASKICGTPIALVSLVDAERQWFKSTVGLDAKETHRDLAFCAHAILDPEQVLVVPDATRDPRFADNSLVLEDPNIRFYAGSPLLTPEGAALGTICVIDSTPRDLTPAQRESLEALSRQISALLELRLSVMELEDSREKLQVANQQLDDFCHTASHDLKEPLRGLRHYAQFLLEDYGDKLDSEGQDQLATLTRLADRMQALIESLLEYSKASRAEAVKADVDIGTVVEEVVDSLHFSLAERNTKVRVASPLPSVLGERAAVAEVFRNLIGNAMKYNDKNEPWIEIGFEPDPSGHGRFYVRDNGIGIAPEHQDKVFDMFRRLHTGDTYGGGTGSGLAIVKKLVEAHGGEISAESTIGVGTVFRFHFGDVVSEETSVEELDLVIS